MVLVHVQVTLHLNGQVHHAVFANLLQHVVEESQACLNVTVAVAIKVHLNIYIGLLGGALYLCSALTSIGNGSHLVPVAHLQESATDVLCKFTVCITIANDIAVLDVVFGIVHVFLHQSRIGLARWGIVLREMGVYQDVVKLDTLAFQRIEDEVVDRPECILRESVGAQSVLVAHHNEKIVRMLAQKHEVADGPWYELEFLKSVNLLVSRFADNGAVAVDE